MKIKMLIVFLASLIAYSTALKPGAEGPEGEPETVSEQERLEEQKSSLEEQQETLKKQAAQATGAQAESISEQQAAIAQQLKDVDAQLASTPQVTPTEPSEGGIIPVVVTPTREQITQSEQRIMQATTISDWQSNWQRFSSSPWLLGKGGELFTGVEAEDRASALADIVSKTPDTIFTENTFEGVRALTSVARVANDFFSKNQFSQADYDQVMTAVREKLARVIDSGVAGKTLEQSLALLGPVKEEEQILGLGPVGAPDTVWNLVTQNLSGAPQARDDLLTFVSQKMVQTFRKADIELSPQGVEQLAKLAQDMLASVVPEVGPGAQIAIADKFTLYIDEAAKGKEDAADGIGQMLGAYSLISKLDLPDGVVEHIRRKMMDRINAAIGEIPSGVANLEAILSIAEALGDNEVLKDSPATTRLLANKMSSVVSDETTNRTFVSSAIDVGGKPDYEGAYEKELDVLGRYMDFIKEYPISTPEVQAAQVAAAKRIMRITDFLTGQEAFAKSQEQTTSQWLISGIVSAVKGMFAREDALTKLIKEQDPTSDFLALEGQQRNRFSKGLLEALPEDMLIRITRDFNQALKQADAAKTRDDNVKVINSMLDLYAVLSEPLISYGSERYGFNDLLANKQDIDTFNKLSNTIPSEIIRIFTNRYLPQIVTQQGGLGQPSAARTQQEAVLQNMNEYLVTDFKDVAGAAELRDKIKDILQATQAQDTQSGVALADKTQEAISKASQAEIAELSTDEFKKNFDDLINQLKNFLQRQKGGSPEAITRLNDVLTEAQAWRDIADVADSYTAMIASTDQDVTASQNTYVTLSQTAASVAASIDYRQKTLFVDRLDRMGRQGNALGKLVDLFSQQKAGPYTLAQLADAMDKIVNFIEVPDDIRKMLIDQGYLQEPEAGIFAPTVKGHVLVDIGRENTAIVTRRQQLQDYVRQNPREPGPLVIEDKPAASKLASDLNLSKLILVDQLTALKQQYGTALQNLIVQTAIRIEQTIPLNINTVEEAIGNAATLLGLSNTEVEDPVVLGKKLGLSNVSNDTINTPAMIDQMAEALKIETKDMNDAQVIGARLGMTPEEISQAAPGRLSFANNTTRVELMQRELLDRMLQERNEQISKQQDAAASKVMLAQIGDILAQLRKQNGTDTIDAYFEAMVALKQELIGSPQEANFKATDRLMSIIGALDASAILEVDPPTILGQMRGVLTGTGVLVKDGLSGLILQTRVTLQNIRKGVGKVVRWSSLPAFVVTTFLTAIGIRAAWSAGTTALAGTAGTVMGPVAGVATYIMAPGPGFVPELGGLVVGGTAGFLLNRLGQSIEQINPQQLEALNEELVRKGYEKIVVSDKKGWAEASKEWVTNLFKSNMQIWSQTAASKKADIQKKTDLFMEAKTQFYEMLGLPPTASNIEVEAALTRKEAQLKLSWGINRWLQKRQYDKAYRFMVTTGRDLSEANVDYMSSLNQMAVKVLAVPAKRSQSAGAGYVWALGRDYVDSALSWVSAAITGKEPEQPEEGRVLKPDQFSTYKQQIDDFYQQQMLELTVLKDKIAQDPDVIKKASPFEDDTYVSLFQSLIDGRIDDLRDDYEQGLMALLSEHGIDVAPSSKAS